MRTGWTSGARCRKWVGGSADRPLKMETKGDAVLQVRHVALALHHNPGGGEMEDLVMGPLEGKGVSKRP
jgi:hypothetical protein